MNYATITAKEAKQRGYKPLTYPFTKDEYPMLKKVVHDMEKDDLDYVLVTESDNPTSISVFRKTSSV